MMPLDLTLIATYVLYATAGFIYLPAGRDIVNYKLNIFPGEDTMRKAFNMTKVPVRTFFWGVWVSANLTSRCVHVIERK